jgi:tetratricopeptide (TPR) repeat protein
MFEGFLPLLAIIVCLAIVPWSAKLVYFAERDQGESDLSPKPGEVTQLATRLSESRNLTVLDSRYVASPTLVAHPLIQMAIGLSLVLLFCPRRDLGAQFLFSNMIVPLAVIYNPITATLLGQLITATQMWRIRWMLPVSLVISFVLLKLIGLLTSRLGRGRNSRSRRVLFAVLSLLAVAGVVAPFQSVIELRLSKPFRVASLDAEQRDVLERVAALIPQEGAVWTSTLMSRYLLSFSGKLRPLIHRKWHIDETIVEATARFYESKVLTKELVQTLSEYDAEYVIVAVDDPVSPQLARAPYTFRLAYSNAGFGLYQVMLERLSDPGVVGDLYALEGDWERAIESYSESIGAVADDPFAYMALGRAYWEAGLTSAATRSYQRAVELLPDSQVALEALAACVGVEPSYALAFATSGAAYQSPIGADVAANLMDLVSVHPPEVDASVELSALAIDRLPKGVILQPAPSRIELSIGVPENARLDFCLALAPETWSLGNGDGVQFAIEVETASGIVYRAFEEYLDPKNVVADRRWHHRQVDLSRWSGNMVTLSLVTRPGPNGDSRLDLAAWGEPRIVQPAD